MIQRVLIDSDVVLDVATGRQPFVGESKPVLAHMEQSRALGLISAHSIITRNTDDYLNAGIPVYTPREYLVLYAPPATKASDPL